MNTVLAGAGLIFTCLVASTALAQGAPPPAKGAAPPPHGAAPPHEHGTPQGHDPADHDPAGQEHEHGEEHEHPIAPPGPPQPYSLPWQLRPAIPVTAVRNDLTFAWYRDPATAKQGFTAVESLIALVKVEPWLSLGARATAVGNVAPGNGVSSGTFGNPAVFAMFGIHARDFHITPWLTFVLPLGMGGGDHPDVGPDTANKAAQRARSSMDNSIFAPNYFALVPGIDVAWVRGGLTVQAEATLFQLMRVKGATASPDSAITNLTMGLHLGYFFSEHLSVGAEIRHQRLLTTTTPVAADAALPANQQMGLRDVTTMGIGPRFHFKIGETRWIRPGVAFSRGFDKPLSKAQYSILAFDVPIVF